MTLNDAHELTEYWNRPGLLDYPRKDYEQDQLDEAYRMIAEARERLWKLTERTS